MLCQCIQRSARRSRRPGASPARSRARDVEATFATSIQDQSCGTPPARHPGARPCQSAPGQWRSTRVPRGRARDRYSHGRHRHKAEAPAAESAAESVEKTAAEPAAAVTNGPATPVGGPAGELVDRQAGVPVDGLADGSAGGPAMEPGVSGQISREAADGHRFQNSPGRACDRGAYARRMDWPAGWRCPRRQREARDVARARKATPWWTALRTRMLIVLWFFEMDDEDGRAEEEVGRRECKP